jgi:hypothetical protein
MSALISSIEHSLAFATSDVVKVAKFWPQERPGGTPAISKAEPYPTRWSQSSLWNEVQKRHISSNDG